MCGEPVGTNQLMAIYQHNICTGCTAVETGKAGVVAGGIVSERLGGFTTIDAQLPVMGSVRLVLPRGISMIARIGNDIGSAAFNTGGVIEAGCTVLIEFAFRFAAETTYIPVIVSVVIHLSEVMLALGGLLGFTAVSADAVHVVVAQRCSLLFSEFDITSNAQKATNTRLSAGGGY